MKTVLTLLFLLIASPLFAEQYGVMIFSAKWSSSCSRMNTEVWPDKEVKNTLNKYKYTRWQLDSKEHKKNIDSWRIVVYPTIVIVKKNSQGKWKEITRVSGFLTKERLIAFLKIAETKPSGKGTSLQN